MKPSQRNHQLTFIPWLINEINSGHHPGLEWIDASQQVACIPWPRAKENLPLEELGVIYCWHKYRFGSNCNQNRTPSSLKGTFRAIINSRDEITKLRDEEAVIHIQINCSATPTAQNTLFNFNTPPTPDQLVTPGRYHTSSSEHSSLLGQNSPSSVCSLGSLSHWPGGAVPVTTVGRQSSYDGPPYDVMTSPTWSQQIMKEEQRSTDSSCNVYVSVFSRGTLLCDKRANLENGLLIYSDICEADFSMQSDCDSKYGKGATHADKLFINELQVQSQRAGDEDLIKALKNFNNGILLTSDAFFNILVQRHCRVRTYFGHSNQGGARQMRRPSSEDGLYNPVYSYISFLEMAGYLMYMLQNRSPVNQSDQPTAVTYIAVGQEWTPSKPIQALPLFIEIKHERAINYQQANLKLKSDDHVPSGIVVSITNSLDCRPCGTLEFDDTMMNNIVNEMPDEDMELDLSDFLDTLGLELGNEEH